MNVRYPVWLRTAQQRPGARVFAALFAVESVARGILSTVITVQALHLFESVRDVNLAFSVVGLGGLIASFSIPAVVRVISRRWTYTLGAALMIAAALAFASYTQTGQIIGMLARVYGTACLNITLSLFILQYIRRSELTVLEPKRMQYSAIAWAAGPLLGVALYEQVGVTAPYLVSVVAAVTLIVFFWILRLRESSPIQPATSQQLGPLRSIGRFVAQPRLRLAWFIVFCRSAWWVFFYIYAAVYAVESGLGEMAGAAIISAGNVLLFFTPTIGRRADRFGVRGVLLVGLLVAGVSTALCGAVIHHTWAVVVGLLVGAFGAVILDSVGNVPFLAAVRVRERDTMTTVFRTYMDAAEMIPPAVFALILTYLELEAVFVFMGVFLLVAMYWVRLLPARLGKKRIRIDSDIDGLKAPTQVG